MIRKGKGLAYISLPEIFHWITTKKLSSKASIRSSKSIKTEQAMLTVIVLITLPTNIDIIFVRIILMWNNNDEDYDHVDAGNQERAELGKKLYSIPTLGLTFA